MFPSSPHSRVLRSQDSGLPNFSGACQCSTIQKFFRVGYLGTRRISITSRTRTPVESRSSHLPPTSVKSFLPQVTIKLGSLNLFQPPHPVSRFFAHSGVSCIS